MMIRYLFSDFFVTFLFQIKKMGVVAGDISTVAGVQIPTGQLIKI
jgi:hypothetical protein